MQHDLNSHMMKNENEEFTLTEKEPLVLQEYLRKHKLIKADEVIQKMEVPGDGNMNLTLRIVTDKQSLVVKQSSDFVRKYPSIPAPRERAEMETEFYRRVRNLAGVAEFMPRHLFLDSENYLQVIEDLGGSSDFTYAYSESRHLDRETVSTLIEYLKNLHGKTHGSESLENKKMRILNHEHIFILPFIKNGSIDLEAIHPGLSHVANETIFRSPAIAEAARGLGNIYLSANNYALLHGDFFPGSWLDTKNGIRIIDPEFCFTGAPEYDLGVFAAHLCLCGWELGEVYELLNKYGKVDQRLVMGFMATEVLRRLFGVAQLPITYSLEKKHELAEKALTKLQLCSNTSF